jgi:hypothetical protein
MDACSSFNFVEVDKELLHLVTAALFAVCFFLESLPCAVLCIQVDVSALGKIDFGSPPCSFETHLASKSPSFSLKVIDAFLILGWAIFRDSIP